MNEVYELRAMYQGYLDGADYSVNEIARRFNITDSTCSKIGRGITYKEYV